MKSEIKHEIFKVIKISSMSLLVACGSGGSKKLVPGLDSAGRQNPQSDDVEGDQGSEDAEDPSSSDDHGGPHSGGDGMDDSSSGDSMDPNMPGDGSKSNEPDIQKIFPKTGIRNFAQINATMSSLTGVPTTNAQITAFYNAQATSLPTDNDVKGFIGSQQVAVFKLAVEYCDVLVKDTALRASIFGTFNFAAAPNVAFATDAKNALADSLVSKFWGKNLSTLAPHAENVSMVVTLIDDLLNGRDLTVATQTAPIATGTCAGVLSSAPVTLY